jgi:hypothetical protein
VLNIRISSGEEEYGSGEDHGTSPKSGRLLNDMGVAIRCREQDYIKEKQLSSKVYPIQSTVQAQLRTQNKVPEGHVRGICYVRMFGPERKADPSGHPIQISSGVFDASIETPLSAVKRAANRWHGLAESADSDWELIMEEDVIQPKTGSQIGYDKVFVFRYLPEEPLRKHLGIHDKVVNHFENCHYITAHHKHTAVNILSAHELKAPKAQPSLPASTDNNKGGRD